MEIDNVAKDLWHSLLIDFSDASFYQTWSYGAAQWGNRQLSHLILKYERKVVAMAQLRIVGIAALRLGTGYLSWGPMWQLKGEPPNLSHLKNMMRALRAEYAVRRGYLLRVLPRVPACKKNEEIRSSIEQEMYVWSADPLETVLVDLSPSLDELRRSLRKSWSRSLNFAEHQNLEIFNDSTDQSCDIALQLAKEMQERKQFYGSSQPTVVAAHKDLPANLKLRICVCRDHGEPVAVLGWATMGSIGIGLLGATGQKALNTKASFLLWWKMVEYYKAHGYCAIDLAAVNAERNSGGYFFKVGLAGRNFKEPNRFIGQFETVVNPLSANAAKIAYSISTYRKRMFFRLAKITRAVRPTDAKRSDGSEMADTRVPTEALKPDKSPATAK